VLGKRAYFTYIFIVQEDSTLRRIRYNGKLFWEVLRGTPVPVKVLQGSQSTSRKTEKATNTVPHRDPANPNARNQNPKTVVVPWLQQRASLRVEEGEHYKTTQSMVITKDWQAS